MGKEYMIEQYDKIFYYYQIIIHYMIHFKRRTKQVDSFRKKRFKYTTIIPNFNIKLNGIPTSIYTVFKFIW